jgi:hypothetical protein
MIEMSPWARMSIQPWPEMPPEVAVSAVISPKWVPVESMTTVVPDQISTQAVELAALPGRVGGVQSGAGLWCAGPWDATRP